MLRISSSTTNSTFYIVLLAVFTALTTVATIVIVVPFGPGYLNFGDTMVMISGIVLGPLGGLIAGGIGSAMADVALGWVGFAPITLLVKGTEGLVVGLFSLKAREYARLTRWDVLGIFLAAITMLTGYYFFEVWLYGPEAALAELIGINWIQVTVGGIIAAMIGPSIRFYLANLHVQPNDEKEMWLEEEGHAQTAQ